MGRCFWGQRVEHVSFTIMLVLETNLFATSTLSSETNTVSAEDNLIDDAIRV
jgi:hypothetical protein